MLLELVEYSKHQSLPGAGFAPKTVKWAIQATIDGQFMGIVPLGDTSKKKNPGREFAVCPETSGMNSGGKSHFLVETLETVLLMCKDDNKRPGFETKHEFFVRQLRDASSVCPEMCVFANLIDDETDRAKMVEQLQQAKAKPTDKITMMIEGRNPPFLVDDTIWHDWWADYRKTLGGTSDGEAKPKARRPANKSSTLMRCFVTGEMVEPAATHPKITELTDVGASAMGASLVSFDKDSLCSYGLSQSSNAAMSEESAAAYRAALNHILAERGHRLAGAKVAYWFKDKVPEENDPGKILFSLPDEDSNGKQDERDALAKARELLHAIRSGKSPAFTKNNRYYALTLSGNGGRVVVRDWLTGSFEELLENVLGWFDDLAIVHRRGEGLASPPKFMAVLGSLVRDLKDVPSPLIASMWTAAICRRPIPRTAVARAVERARIDVIDDKPPNHARMGLIRAYHKRKGDTDMNKYLNEDHPSKAYQCGRLMAVLANVQYAALGDVGAGVVQRYYAAASATPALVFGRLVRQSQFHLNKIDNKLAKWFDRQIADIWTKIKDDLPRTLSLDEQSLFAMGFYQQKAHRSEKKADDGENTDVVDES
ncbi:MAG: type I-C CRISPR-associated protein Cas8c/Csd1 [Pirellulaceae bacterium]|nr:type I-C CRISPR-associated protein Cas8c/Csd1 [Pirellulaceae bacterium]